MTDCEGYFIQLLFCRNRELLKKENRLIYDALYERYQIIFNEGTLKHVADDNPIDFYTAAGWDSVDFSAGVNPADMVWYLLTGADLGS